jgi:magnesium transporter
VPPTDATRERPVPDAATREPAVRIRLYRNGRLALTDFPVADVSENLDVDGSVIWLDLCGPTQADFDMIGEEFGLHKLAIEDALHASERPKLDRYATHLFLDAYAVDPGSATGELAVNEIAAFITPRALITVRKGERFDIAAVLERWDASPDLARHGVGVLLHGLLDHVVDGHFAAVQSLDRIEHLEDLLFDEGRRVQAVQRDSFKLRKNLVLLRRVVLPMREVLNTLVRRDLAIVQPAMAPYCQDVYDHVRRATEWTESLRDLVTTILETNLTVQANRMNLIMKKVTSLGGDHRGTHRHHQVLRPEPAIPRLRHPRRIHRLHRAHPRPVRPALPDLQGQGLAVTRRSDGGVHVKGAKQWLRTSN